MKRTIVQSVLVAGMASAALTGSARAQPSGPPRGAQVESITAVGPGCPDESEVSAAFSSNGEQLVLRFGAGQMEVALGPAIPPSEAVSTCRVQMNLSIPPGWRFSIENVTYHGYADLDTSVLARHTTRYWFQGTRAPARVAHLYGPKVEAEYSLDSPFGPSAVWSLCGVDRPLIIQTALGLTNLLNPLGGGYVSLGGPQHSIVYNLSWERCGGRPLVLP